jgi:hypothetical protein
MNNYKEIFMAIMRDDDMSQEEREKYKNIIRKKEEDRLNETIEIELSTDVGWGLMETRRYSITRAQANKLFAFSDASHRIAHLEHENCVHNMRF